MIKYFKKIKELKLNGGMTYVELIVVLSIFSIVSGVVIFDYGRFQSKVNLKNLSNDIALKIVQAQKDAMSGLLATGASPSWKPAYGVYFNITDSNKRFFYIKDLDNGDDYDGSSGCTSECMDNIAITGGNTVSAFSVTGTGSCTSITSMTIVFTRPDSSAKITTNQPACTQISYAEITLSSPKAVTTKVKVYSSGRVQIN